MKRIRGILIFALCIVLALAPMVSANSGPAWWEGTTASGMIVTGEDCPIVVDHETLTFEIPAFPAEYYSQEDDFAVYPASVTAEYTFRNPTDADVTVELLFPFGTVPDYAPGIQMLPWKYTVTADGAPVETVLRHSLVSGDFDMAADSARLHDGYMDHAFYTPETPVTTIRYRPAGVAWEEDQVIRAKLRLDSDPSRTKYTLSPANSYETEEGYALAGSGLMEGDEAWLTIFGAVPEEPLEWMLFRNGEQIEGTMEVISVEETTLKEYLLSSLPADVSETDWYNAVIQNWDRHETQYGYWDVDSLRLMGWYEYSLTIPAGETLVNAVTAPVYPDIHNGWDPAIYTYEYLLSPAKGWADFGTLDIQIKTPYHMTQCNLGTFRKTDEGYRMELDGLPEKELTFVLSEDADPNPPGTNAAGMLWFLLVAGLLLVLGWVLRRRDK